MTNSLDLIIGLFLGLTMGGVIVWVIAKSKFKGSVSQKDLNILNSEISKLEIENTRVISELEQVTKLLDLANSVLLSKTETINSNISQIATLAANVKSAKDNEESSVEKLEIGLAELKDVESDKALLKTQLAEIEVRKGSISKELNNLEVRFEKIESDLDIIALDLNKSNQKNVRIEGELTSEKDKSSLKSKTIADLETKYSNSEANLDNQRKDFNKSNADLQKYKAENKSLQEKLDTQKDEIENLGKKFNLEFNNIANKILEEKSEKFTNVNKENLNSILKPLGENINQFKKQVADTYEKEANARFSLEDQVKKMADLNKVISDEARNLTNALKGEAKTQGNWGEMILESILEKSGLRKGEEYFMEHQLFDDDGNALRSESEDKKMRPDAVIKYPDERSVIIDSKVSLNAFTRYMKADDVKLQEIEMKSHVDAVKKHIISLSTKGYDDYDKALDFVMMFIPSEPAYIAAMQGDSNLWNFAYDKRILLMNPTNLITSLKLIEDLWKREYQNQNAKEIASRGGKLYDKFVGFVKNLEGIGDYIDKAQGKYSDAYKQLNTGNDNLVLQATKLKELGLKTKKELTNKKSIN